MPGAQGSPDHSHSTWGDVGVSWAELPPWRGSLGGCSPQGKQQQWRAQGLPGHHLLMDTLQSTSHHLGKGPG